MLSPEREGRLTASNFGAAIGVNPYMSRQKLFRTIKGLEPKFEGNEMTQWGNDHEQDAVDAYEAAHGVIVLDAGDKQAFVIDAVHDWLGCTPDGRVAGEADRLLEVKCPYNKMYKDIPAYYMAQIQGQMYITQHHQCDFVAWTEDELRVWRVDYNETYWEVMFKMLNEFWDYVQDDIEPKRKRKPVLPDVKYELLF